MVGTVGQEVVVVLALVVADVEEVLQVVEADGVHHQLSVLSVQTGNAEQEESGKGNEGSFHVLFCH